jgi:hypothetical protein
MLRRHGARFFYQPIGVLPGKGIFHAQPDEGFAVQHGVGVVQVFDVLTQNIFDLSKYFPLLDAQCDTCASLLIDRVVFTRLRSTRIDDEARPRAVTQPVWLMATPDSRLDAPLVFPC